MQVSDVNKLCNNGEIATHAITVIYQPEYCYCLPNVKYKIHKGSNGGAYIFDDKGNKKYPNFELAGWIITNEETAPPKDCTILEDVNNLRPMPVEHQLRINNEDTTNWSREDFINAMVVEGNKIKKLQCMVRDLEVKEIEESTLSLIEELRQSILVIHGEMQKRFP